MQFWDSWQHPSCIIAQFNDIGQLVIHDVLLGDGIGTKELIEEQIDPLLNTPKYKGKINILAGEWETAPCVHLTRAASALPRQKLLKTDSGPRLSPARPIGIR